MPETLKEYLSRDVPGMTTGWNKINKIPPLNTPKVPEELHNNSYKMRSGYVRGKARRIANSHLIP